MTNAKQAHRTAKQQKERNGKRKSDKNIYMYDMNVSKNMYVKSIVKVTKSMLQREDFIYALTITFYKYKISNRLLIHTTEEDSSYLSTDTKYIKLLIVH